MANGGKRAGAGRKPGSKAKHTLEAEKYREILIAKIVEKAEPLAAALIKKGLTGDVPALKEINERALGKVKENIDLTSKGEKITGFNYTTPDAANNHANAKTAPRVAGAPKSNG